MKDFMMQIWPDLTVSREIGQGPFSKVYEVVPKSGDGLVEVVKVISFKGNVQIMEAVAGDLRLMKKLSGTGAVVDIKDFKVFEHGDHAGFDIYVRMEKLTPLSLMIGRRAFSEKEVVNLAEDVLDDLKVIDDQGALHMNVKPSNIFMDNRGHYKLADLCSTRRLEAVTGQEPAAQARTCMAPELLSGKASDIRADIYSLGCVLKMIMPPSASEELKQMVEGACEIDPDNRFMKPAAMRNALSFLKLEEPRQAAQPAYMNTAKVQAGRQSGPRPGTQAGGPRPAPQAGGSRPAPQPGGQNGPRPVPQAGGQRPGQTPVPETKKSKVPLLIGIAVVIGILIVVIALVFGRKKDDDGDTVREAIAASEAVDENGQETETETKESTEKDTSDADTKKDTQKETKEGATGTGGSQSQTGATHVEFIYHTESGGEYADVIGYNNDKVIWSYTTAQYPQAQCKRVSEIGNFDHNGGVFYMVEDGTVICFDIATGEIRWKNSDFGGVITENSCAFDANGNLYICGYLSPHLFILSEQNGQTVKRIDQAMDGYYRPYKIELSSQNANYMEITFEQGPNGEHVILYYSIPDGTFSTDMSASGSTTSSVDAGTAGKAIDNSVIKSVSASSYLDEPQYGLTHDANCLIDGSTSTAWCEDVAGNGEGEWVKFELSSRCMVSGFTIYNGHQQDSDLYQKNSRVRKVTVTFSDGTEQTYELADKLGKQGFNFDKPVDTDSVKFTIVSVYEGYKYEDTCISEISLKGTVK